LFATGTQTDRNAVSCPAVLSGANGGMNKVNMPPSLDIILAKMNYVFTLSVFQLVTSFFIYFKCSGQS